MCSKKMKIRARPFRSLGKFNALHYGNAKVVKTWLSSLDSRQLFFGDDSVGTQFVDRLFCHALSSLQSILEPLPSTLVLIQGQVQSPLPPQHTYVFLNGEPTTAVDTHIIFPERFQKCRDLLLFLELPWLTQQTLNSVVLDCVQQQTALVVRGTNLELLRVGDNFSA